MTSYTRIPPLAVGTVLQGNHHSDCPGLPSQLPHEGEEIDIAFQ
jgi:hypothetical protein